MYNKKENLHALRRTVCCLLLTSMLLAALLGFAIADIDRIRTALRATTVNRPHAELSIDVYKRQR